ncbi:unnamed protein product [Cuscuta epithymum]|uniref:BHLH domain-containing protein n=2 Tax=Cuscuta epithymum TaxID=186058 RepID=A0AAV0DX40_9ASTE|nr:unnamed protein product [Cuscuta epithymum]CAH9131208.1 unnamed protein product [Cuscuta epithymum]
MVQEDEIVTENRNRDALNFHSDNMQSEWLLNSTILANPMQTSFYPTWDQSITNLHPNVPPSSTSNLLQEPGNVGMFWTQPNAVLKGRGMFVPTASGMIPQSLPQFPDSNFIQREGRFSCFSGGNDPTSSYAMGLMPTRNPMSPYAVAESSKEGLKNEKANENMFERKECGDRLGNECDEPECSDGGDQEVSEGADGESSSKVDFSKKRKRGGQAELEKNNGIRPWNADVTQDQTVMQLDIDQNLVSTPTKQGRKAIKQGSHTSDPSKEEYMHVRARRGQATNSHSLAERVRREKISQRMKYLQDLVPGCNKVTGKAVMLDEIINYVQSLQRQVEFLSMKLSTVVPQMDFNIDGLLAKDIIQSQSSPSLLTFPRDITDPYTPLNPPQPPLLQGGLPGYGNSLEALLRTLNSEKAVTSVGYKCPTPQVPNMWDNELQNAFGIDFTPNHTLNNHHQISSRKNSEP